MLSEEILNRALRRDFEADTPTQAQVEAWLLSRGFLPVDETGDFQANARRYRHEDYMVAARVEADGDPWFTGSLVSAVAFAAEARCEGSSEATSDLREHVANV